MPECFEALVGLLAVVEARGHSVDGEVGGFDELRARPAFGAWSVVAFDVAVDLGMVSRCSIGWAGAGMEGVPSRTLKPTLFQSIVSTGGGGNADCEAIVMISVQSSESCVGLSFKRGRRRRGGSGAEVGNTLWLSQIELNDNFLKLKSEIQDEPLMTA